MLIDMAGTSFGSLYHGFSLCFVFFNKCFHGIFDFGELAACQHNTLPIAHTCRDISTSY